MAYTKQTWVDGTSPRSAARFNHQEDGIKDAHDLIDATIGSATSAEVDALEFTTEAAYADLTTAGPAVTVDVGSSGRLQVTIGASLEVFDIPAGSRGTADMSFELTGPTAVAPSNKRALIMRSNNTDDLVQMSRTKTITGLAPGTYTVTCRYRQAGSCSARFGFRSLDVIPL